MVTINNTTKAKLYSCSLMDLSISKLNIFVISHITANEENMKEKGRTANDNEYLVFIIELISELNAMLVISSFYKKLKFVT